MRNMTDVREEINLDGKEMIMKDVGMTEEEIPEHGSMRGQMVDQVGVVIETDEIRTENMIHTAETEPTVHRDGK